MKIPENYGDKMAFVQEVIETCQASQESRRAGYRTLKQYYLYGQESGTATDANVFGTVNKIYPHIDKTTSMLYSSDSTRFGVEVARSVSDQELGKVQVLSDAVGDHWHQSETDIRFGEALKWSHVYGSMFIKARPKKQSIITDLVEPHNFGVWREDLMGLENQEAYFHEYRITKSQLEYDLRTAGHQGVDAIVKAAVDNSGDDEGQITQSIDTVITSSAMPNVVGEVNTYTGARLGYVARLKQPMVRMYELYVFDDDIEDFRVFTCAHPWVPVYDRPIDRIFLADESPFTQVCPDPVYGYFWGISPVERLLTLQMLRNTRWYQVQHLMELQAQPPSFATGELMAAGDEIQAALDTANGLVLAANQGSTMQRMAPQMPDDLFAEVNYLDSQFDDALGTTETMSGKGETGVRSEGHANKLMQAGSTRAKARALIIERQIESLATLFLKIMQKYSDRTYRSDDGTEFLANQFTDQYMVRVDSHSSSPIFMTDIANLAFSLFKAKAITRERLIEMLPVPMRNLLKRELRTKIEPAEAKAAQEQKAIELQTGKVSPMRKKS